MNIFFIPRSKMSTERVLKKILYEYSLWNDNARYKINVIRFSIGVTGLVLEITSLNNLSGVSRS